MAAVAKATLLTGFLCLSLGSCVDDEGRRRPMTAGEAIAITAVSAAALAALLVREVERRGDELTGGLP